MTCGEWVIVPHARPSSGGAVSDDLREKYDALVDAAWAVVRDWETSLLRSENVLALKALLPKPLRRGDMVEQADADRVPAGAILRAADGKAVEVVADGDERVWFTSGYSTGQRPSAIEADAWPMRVVWLPEDGEL